MLWQKFPNHRLLLPAHFHFGDHNYDHNDHHNHKHDDTTGKTTLAGGDKSGGDGGGGDDDDFDASSLIHRHEWVSKPRYGREGMGVVYVSAPRGPLHGGVVDRFFCILTCAQY